MENDQLRFWHVDAFAKEAFAGNPASVTLAEGPLGSPDWGQKLADEFNLPINVIVWPKSGASGESFCARYFSPKSEVPISGHGTISTCHVLWEAGIARLDQEIVLETAAGHVSAKRDGAMITIRMPRFAVTEDFVGKEDLEEAFGNLPIETSLATTGTNQAVDKLLLLESEQAVRDFEPDLLLICRHTERGLILSAPTASSDYDFVSRFFAPNFGLPEDWVTGLSHSTLFPYWAERLGKKELIGKQVSRRPGEILGSVEADAVLMAGQVTTVMSGTLRICPA